MNLTCGRSARIRSILNSYDVLGGPATLFMLWSILKMLNDPQTIFTTTPQNVMKTVGFMHKIGTLKTLPDSWNALFFPAIHRLPGS